MINDYTTLSAAVANWLARADLSARIPDFIQLAELRIWRDLKVRQMLTTVTGTTISSEFDAPADYLSPVRLTINVGGVDVELEPLTSVRGKNARFGGIGFGYAIEGNVFRVIGGQGEYDYTLMYYAKASGLEAANTNWLIVAAPDVYLYACLLEATPYLKADARIGVWQAGYQAAIDALNRQSDESRFSPSPRMRPNFRAP